jgi:hypothetical protein
VKIILSKIVRKRCIICGRAFETKVLDDSVLEGDLFTGPPEKSTSFCSFCEAKIKKEAEDTQKEPKPM